MQEPEQQQSSNFIPKRCPKTGALVCLCKPSRFGRDEKTTQYFEELQTYKKQNLYQNNRVSRDTTFTLTPRYEQPG